MQIMKLFTSVVLFSIMLSCNEDVDPTKLFTIQLNGKEKVFANHEAVSVKISNEKNKAISGVAYSIDGKTLPYKDGKVTLSAEQLGNKILKATVNYEDTSVDILKKIKLLASKSPEIYTYEILNIFPHDIDAYTQGLEFKNDTLYESTGQKGNSTLRKVKYTTGEVLQRVELDANDFGEGLTILEDNIYQLTWRNRKGYVYNLKDLKKIKTFNYGQSKEGWGLCNDQEKIYKSDGTEKIWFLNPKTLEEEGFIEIVTNKSIFNKANELEYVDGKIYANVYGKESLMIIDAKSGAIEGVVSFAGLKKHIVKGDNWDDSNSVFNGVAYHPDRKTFFVTGKNWDKLFEINILKK